MNEEIIASQIRYEVKSLLLTLRVFRKRIIKLLKNSLDELH